VTYHFPLPIWASLAACAYALTPSAVRSEPQAQVRLERLSVDDVLSIAARLMDAGKLDEAQVLLDRLREDQAGGTERDFLDGMVAAARKDYRRAEMLFRKILAENPKLVRVRLELARTLFLMKRDEQADYHFRLAIAERPEPAVVANITRYREAIRARRAWRFNVNLGIAPDSNINSATSKEEVEILGLPFQLDPSARARSGVGFIVGGDASVRVWRHRPVPLYLAAYGQVTRYPAHEFDDYYLGGEAGPEFRLGGGRLRVTGTAFHRWYGGKPLNRSFGGRVYFDKVIKGRTGVEAALSFRRDDYTSRDDTDAWNLEGSVSVNRALGPSTLGFAYAAVLRNMARDPGYSHWSGRLGAGLLKEIGWGLRPQLGFEVGRQVNDAALVIFGKERRDWSLRASASIYKRDWNVAGFAPSLRVSWSRTWSTVALYDQKRWRTEFGLAKAF